MISRFHTRGLTELIRITASASRPFSMGLTELPSMGLIRLTTGSYYTGVMLMA